MASLLGAEVGKRSVLKINQSVPKCIHLCIWYIAPIKISEIYESNFLLRMVFHRHRNVKSGWWEIWCNVKVSARPSFKRSFPERLNSQEYLVHVSDHCHDQPFGWDSFSLRVNSHPTPGNVIFLITCETEINRWIDISIRTISQRRSIFVGNFNG